MNEQTDVQPVIQIKTLTKTYPQGLIHRYEALKEVGLSVKKAEIFGFLGPNGAGKTTLIKSILGLLTFDSGSIKLFNKNIDDADIKNNIGYLPETPNFYSYLTAFEIMKLYARLYNMKENVDTHIKEKLDLVGLQDAIHTRLRAFSKGMLQRLGMAQALINDPELLILDEPMSGLDPIGRAEFKEIMRKLKKQGKTIFFSSHIIPDAEELCDHVAVIRTGRIIKTGTVSELVDTGATSVDITATGKLTEQIKQAVKDITCTNEQCIFHLHDMEKTTMILNELIKSGFSIIRVEPVRQSLETLISKMIKEN